MKIFSLYIPSLFLFLVCNSTISSISQNEIPKVKLAQTYDLVVEKDIVYAKGLSHESINSPNANIIPLMLDVYFPDNDIKNRPVYLFIHGGGFSGGTKQQSHIINLANYYASRGWVFISIDYRLKKDKGTVPQEWLDYSLKVPKERISQFLAIYPAIRDTKAALRWVVANADTYHINTDYITVGGGSAGAITTIAVGVSNQEDFRDEINMKQDPTLATTNLDQSYQIKTIIDLWGSKVALDGLEQIFGHQRFDRKDPSLFIAHGTLDDRVPYSSAEDLKSIYVANGVSLGYYPLKEKGHGAWKAMVDNKTLEELAFDFIVKQQHLVVE